MTLVDFHCHLADVGGYRALRDRSTLFEEQPIVLAVTNRPADWKAMTGTTSDSVAWALGLHPASRFDSRHVAELLALLPSAEAIGEIGLDYSTHARTSRPVQRKAFEDILSHDSARRRLVTIHSRGAATDVVKALSAFHTPGAILHWFLGNDTDIEAAIDLDVYFSVNESMVTGGAGRRVVESLPPNRVLLETDAPFGGRRGREIGPADFDRTLTGLARAWGRSEDDVVALVEKNQTALLSRIDRPRAMRHLTHRTWR